MSTAGTDFRFNNDRPPANNQKRSFLQRLNKRHGKLSLHMRSKRGERSVPRQNEPSHHSPAPSLSTIETSEPSSIVSTTPTEHSYPETVSRYYDVDDDVSPTNLNFSPSSQLEGEFEVPMHYAIAQNDTDGNRDFIQGMHEFMLRKHASNSPKPIENSHGLSLHSRHSSSGGASSHMSEEQVDDWLENPEDAKLHRQRTYSSSDMSAMVHTIQNDNEIKTNAVQKQQIDETQSVPRHSRNISDPHPNVWNTEPEEEGSRMKTITVKELKELAAPHKKVAFKLIVVEESNVRGLLTLPDELLQAIAIRLDMNSTWLLRLSSKRLYDIIPKPDPPAGSEEDLQIFFGNIRSLFPANLIYCGQCRKYHPWMWGDDYYNDDRPGIQAHQCRRHLESGRRPRDEILGPGNYLCDSCNTLRPDKKCKTCGKCVLCAKLRQTWMLMSWIEEECELCAASHSPKWKHWKGEFEGRHNPGAHREWMGV